MKRVHILTPEENKLSSKQLEEYMEFAAKNNYELTGELHFHFSNAFYEPEKFVNTIKDLTTSRTFVTDGECIVFANAFNDGRLLKAFEDNGFEVYERDSGRLIQDVFNEFNERQIHTLKAVINSALESVIVPNGVTTIEKCAFQNCSELKDVTFQEDSQLRTIEGGYSYGAFYGCTSLTSIEIPASVQTIGEAAFEACVKLATVKFDKESRLETIDSRSFYSCPITTIDIPASVEIIGAAAFSGCTRLASVKFESNSQLKAIAGGYNPSDGAFYGCTSLTSIEIPASVQTIGKAAFQECTKLATVKFDKESRLKTIAPGSFYRCPITTIDIPASVQTIGEAAFQECTKLATVRFEHNSQLKSIEGGYYRSSSGSDYFSGPIGAFYRLPNLRTVDMSNCTQVESIGGYAFYGNSELRLVKIGTPTPPTCDQAAFGVNPQSVLKVPTGCADAYKAAIGWRGFTSITGLDE